MNGPSTTAVIVTYQSAGMVNGTLAAAREAHEAGVLECVLVDNASTDGTAERVKRDHPWVQVVANNENLGYGRACNLGLSRVKTEYALFMNPDAVLPLADLGALIRFMDERPQAGMVAPAIRLSNGETQGTAPLPTPWGVVAKIAGLSPSRWRRRPISPGGAPVRSMTLCGAVLLARRDLILRLNGFDPRFFLYFEETDLCKRILDSGMELWNVCQASATHTEATSARSAGMPLFGDCIARHFFASRFYYLVKHHGYLRAAGAELGELFLLAAVDLWKLLSGGGGGRLRARLRGPVLRPPPKPPERHVSLSIQSNDTR